MGYSLVLVFLFLSRKASPQKLNNASVFLNFPSDISQMNQCLTLSFGTFPCLHSRVEKKKLMVLQVWFTYLIDALSWSPITQGILHFSWQSSLPKPSLSFFFSFLLMWLFSANHLPNKKPTRTKHSTWHSVGSSKPKTSFFLLKVKGLSW